MSRRFSLGLRLLVSGGLMALLLLYFVDLKEAARVLARADWGWLLALALVVVLDRVWMSEKWRVLLTCRGVDLGHREGVRAYFLASFAGYFLPSTVGADALRVGVVTGPGRPSEVVAGSVFMERALGFPAAALAALVGGALLAGLVADLSRQVLWWSAGLLALGSAAVGATIFGPLGTWLESLAGRLEGRNPLVAWLGRLATAYSGYRRHPAALALFFVLTFLEQIAPVIGVWCAARALGTEVSFLAILAVSPVAHLFIRVPVSLSGFGVVEGLYVAFFGLVGVDATQAFLLGLVTSLSVVVTTLPGAVLFAIGGFRTPASVSSPQGGGGDQTQS